MRLVFCLVLLFPAALGMGLALPSLAASARVDGHDPGRWIGRVFASNTLGTITGSLACGFVLLGRVGSDRLFAMAVPVALALAFGALALARDARPGRGHRIALGVGALVSLGLALGFRGFDPHRLTKGTHYYWTLTANDEQVASVREDPQSGFITVSASASGIKTLWTNGKYEGTDAEGEFQDLFALFGALYLKNWDRAALVGIGPARTLRVLYEMPFRHIEAIEYSPAILDAAYREFGDFARVPFDDKTRVQVVCDDGRSHLQLSRDRYDYVAVAITGAAFAGSSNIYSRDFFRTIEGRLAPSGVLMLWIQIHHVFPEDVRSVVHTLRSVFPHVHFYTDAGQAQGYLLASGSELTIDAARVEEKLASPRLHLTLAQHGLGSPLDLTERAMFTTPEELDRYMAYEGIARPPVLLTDLRPAFEYSTPYGLASGVYAYDFQPLSDRRLPHFSPPLPRPDDWALQARRHIAGHDLSGALRLLQEAQRESGTSRWDAQIAWVQQRLARAP